MGEQSPAFPADVVRQTAARSLFPEAVDAIDSAEPVGSRHGGRAYTRGNGDADDGRGVTAIKDDEQQQVTDEAGGGQQQIAALYTFEA